jgi:SAM-dependent methyltransferase
MRTHQFLQAARSRARRAAAGVIIGTAAIALGACSTLLDVDFPGRIPSGFVLPDDGFDCVVSIDVLEHLKRDQPFLSELKRVLKPGGKAVVTVPNGDDRLLANQIIWKLGMTPEVYGHTRAGYTVVELSDAIQRAR